MTFTSTASKLFRVTYSWSTVVNELTESQILGNGCVDPETGSFSGFGRNITRARVGHTVEKRDAFDLIARYTRVS
jgi:hypothetical protein